MTIIDNGFVTSINKHGENFIIINILSEHNGLVKGLCRSSKKKSIVLLENVNFDLKKKNYDSLGFIKLETNFNFNSFEDNFFISLIKAAVSELCSTCILEGDKNSEIYLNLKDFLNYLHLAQDDSEKEQCKNFIFWQLGLLRNIGFGLDLSSCAVSGKKTDLLYLSPKTGRAVNANHAGKYINKLFRLPKFLVLTNNGISNEDLFQALNITEYFFSLALSSLNSYKHKNLIFCKEIKKKFI